MTAVAALPQLPPALEQAGCSLVAVGRQLAVLDRDGCEVERAPRKQFEWLVSASTLALVERQAEALGLCCVLHLHELLVRLWWPGADPEAAPWRTFEQALADLAAIAGGLEAREVAEDQAARPQAGKEVEAIPPATIVVEARIVRAGGIWRPSRRQRPGPREAEPLPPVWRWVAEEARRALCARRSGGDGPARGPPGGPGAASYPAA